MTGRGTTPAMSCGTKRTATEEVDMLIPKRSEYWYMERVDSPLKVSVAERQQLNDIGKLRLPRRAKLDEASSVERSDVVRKERVARWPCVLEMVKWHVLRIGGSGRTPSTTYLISWP